MAGNAGDVGKAVTGNPGYSGFCPSWSQPLIPINCGVNERMPLEKRTAPSQTPKDGNPLPSDPDKSGYLLPKRTLASTIYSTDSAQSTAVIEKPKTYTRLNPCPYSVSQLPDHIPFNATTTLNAMHSDVCHDNSPKDFFSNMVKKKSDTSGSLPDLSRRTEGKSISVRGRSGAEGINSLRQAQGVPKETDFEVPKPGYRSGSRGPPGSSEMMAATDVVKFINAAPQVSSYTREYGAVGENLKARLPRFPEETSERSSTADLFPGTSKAVYYDKLPGFMGHVPSNPRNLAMIKGDNDPLNGHHKDTLLITTDNCPAGYSGHRPRAVTNDRGRDILVAGDLTTSGSSAKYVASDNLEKSMNTREHAKLHATKSFFTRGGGEDSAQMCDLFFQRYRPYEGLMKHGNPMDTTWNGDKQRRTTVPVT